MRNKLAAIAAIAIVLSCGLLRAASVPVGGSVTFDSNSPQFVPPTGDLVDSETRTLDLTYTPLNGDTFAPGQDTTASITFVQEVRRDPSTGQLTFLYQMNDAAGPGNENIGKEGALASYTSFGNFSTDVTGDFKAGRLIVSRSADGATLTADGDKMGLGNPPIFAVATDATNFDKNGSLTVTLADEFLVTVPGEPGGATQGAGTATATFDSIFEPAAEGPPPPTGIPLPAGAWSGVVVLGCAAAYGKLRQRVAIV
jgi:hypothetical protein